MFIDCVDNKNPPNKFGETPLHQAALSGNLQLCESILETLENKNPPNLRGKTPLHFSAEGGHTSICKLILGMISNTISKNNQ